jgi:hypothetical protein
MQDLTSRMYKNYKSEKNILYPTCEYCMYMFLSFLFLKEVSHEN